MLDIQPNYIEYTHNYGSIETQNKGTYVGSFIGLAKQTHLNQVNSTTNINGLSYVGGLVGIISEDDSLISKSFYKGNIVTPSKFSQYIGGIGGFLNYTTLSYSYARGSISSGGSYIGGLVGRLSESSEVLNSFSDVDISGNMTLGGIVGYSSEDSSLISCCYSIGKVEVPTINNSKIGGIVGFELQSSQKSHVIRSYWNNQTSGTNTFNGGEPKTTILMSQKSTYIRWDFVEVWDMDLGLNSDIFIPCYVSINFNLNKYIHNTHHT